MPQSHPYQPILLRILHGFAALLTVLALISGFLVYNTYDKRWGSFILPTIGDIQGIHGTMFSWKIRDSDTPHSWLQGIKIKHSGLILKVIEGVVIGGIIMGFIMPIFNS